MTDTDPQQKAAATPRTVLHIGPSGHPTGGVSRYLGQLSRLPTDRTRHHIHGKGIPKRNDFTDYLVAILSIPYQYVSCLAKSEPDILHVHTSQSRGFLLSAAYVLGFSRYWDVPVVLHAHGSQFARFVERSDGMMKRLQDEVFDTVAYTIAVSEDTADAISESFPDQNVVVLRHCVEIDDYEPVAERNGEVRFLFLSNLIKRKGVAELAAAVETLSDYFESGRATLTIAGKGPLSDVVHTLSESYDAVEYRGFVTEDEKRSLINEKDVFVLPTRSEAGVPIAIVEGMAGANAIITTTVSGIPELLDENNGILIPPKDSQSLADAMAAMIEGTWVEEMGEENHRLVKRRYTTKILAERLDGIYLKIERTAD
ncbi:glycosyltransferase family 4 protein [Haladaptatus caseinilyticus]|uniref:glycosyltransferase family 4 protein n=1 Tax=Haladaptatus caseinilyticus TaxID=2993314 RepID=UPI00224A8742|nr:glycosyltransferase family 4 protein [Haladaptatus caseinilyticus]